jgi:sialidase-1
MKPTLTLFTTLLLAPSAALHGAESGKPVFEEQVLFQRQRIDGCDCQYRIPNLIVSSAGTVFAFPEERTGNVSDHAKKNFALKRSRDGGRTWGPREVLRTDPNPRVSCQYASGVADTETGRVLVLYTVGVAIWPEDIGGVWPEKWETERPEQVASLRNKLAPGVDAGLFAIWTDNEGETWSTPKPLGDAVHVVNPVTKEKRPFHPQFVGIQRRREPHRGRLIVPGRGWSKAGMFDLFAYSHNYVAYSDDHGQTWRAGALAQTGTGEACVVELSDGTIYLNSRNESLRGRGYRAWDRSRDGGESFLESGYDLNLPDPHCAASVLRYSDTPSRILFCNPAVSSPTQTHYDHAARRNLTVRLSEDDCRSWPVARAVCAGPAGYSALAVAADGMILCAYEELTEKSYAGDIKLARFNLDWLKQPSLAPQQ